MADIFLSAFVETTISKLTEVLIQEAGQLREVRRSVEWIRDELRYMNVFIEHLERRAGSNSNELRLEEDIKTIAKDAEDVLDNFLKYKRRRKGVVYLLNKYQLAKDLEHITARMKKICERLTKIVDTPGVGVGSATIVSPALEKLDYILTQKLTIRDEVMKKVEHVRDDVLRDTHNIVSNLNSTGELSQRERVWLEEVKELCDYTVGLAEKFIARRERLWLGLYLLLGHHFEMKLMNEMQHIRSQFEDALYRWWTLGDGGEDIAHKMASRPTPTLLENNTPTCTPVPLVSPALLRLSILISDATVSSMCLDKNLKRTRRYLALIDELISDTKSLVGLNVRQKVWVDQLEIVAQKCHSLLARCPKDRFFSLFSRTRYASHIENLLDEILNISDRKNIYGIANIQRGRRELLSSAPGLDPSIQGSSQSEIIDQVENNDNSGTEENPPTPPAFLYSHVSELKRKVKLIKDEKQLMDALSRDEQEFGLELDDRSRIWVDQMKDLARETESLIAKYATEFEHKSWLICILNVRVRHGIIDQINSIRNKIEEASRRRNAYGLFQLQSRAESLSPVQILRSKKQPSLILKESRIIGFDEDAQVLIAQLLSDEKSCCITSIVGIEGTGKSELAKLIYENKDVEHSFDFRIWLSASPSCTGEEFLEKIANEFARMIGESQHRALKILASRKYLIVVDGIGIQTPRFLDVLRENIPDNSTASRFLLTACNANVVRQAGARSFVYHLQLLDDEHSWILFKRKWRDIPLELTEKGKKIVTKCGGLPSKILKLKMSDLLSPQESKDVTEEEGSSMQGRVSQHSEEENPWSETLDIFNTSLPSYLRRCLLYFELFPADFEVPARRLVVLWVAEGLVHHGEDQEPPELIAERYLMELIDLNMVQIAKRKPNGRVKTCRLPNALHELLLIKANESRFPQVHPGTDVNADPQSFRIRQVADRLDENDPWHEHIHRSTTNDSASLRTYYKDVISLLSFDAQEGSKPGQDIGNFLNLCISSNCLLLLRVLDLEGVYKPKLPKNIARLTRLRYLGLRWTYLESLPSSISTLFKLQTLDLKHTYINTLTSSIWKMELRHLFLSETYRTRFPPKPKGIRTGSFLSDLQTLWGLFVDEETPVKGGLDKLVNIRKLGVACQSMSLQQETMKSQLDAVADWIVKLRYLQSLRLKSRDEQGQPWRLHLKSLKHLIDLTDMYLLGCLSNPSILSEFPPSLVELTLSHSKLEVNPMQILKDLPNLRSLSLLAESYMGNILICDSQGFPKLYVLKVWNLEQLEEWKIEQEAFPSLKQLEIRSCPRMKMLPGGLKHVNSLLELKLTNMPVEVDGDENNIPPNCQVHRDDSE